MKKIRIFLGFMAFVFMMNSQAQEELSPYVKFENVSGDIRSIEGQIKRIIVQIMIFDNNVLWFFIFNSSF